jgi:hypothetical protein
MYEDLLKAELTALRLDVRDLSTRVKALERENATLSENQFIQLRLIKDLRGAARMLPMQKDRADILRALLVANGGKMLAKEARQKMHLSESRFSELLFRMAGDIEKRAYHMDRTQNIIILR